jgi:antitoxin VapB
MTDRAKIFMHGRSQAVRLPKEFRLPGKEVKVSRVGRGVLLEPVEKKMTQDEIEAVFREIDRIGGDFMPDGRNQPSMPEDDPIFEG